MSVSVTARRTRDFPISYFLTIRAQAEYVLRIRIMCTHATARAIKCSSDRLALFVSAEDESERRAEATRSDAELLPWSVRRGERERHTNCLVHARLNDHCTIPRCECVGCVDSNQRGILRFHARESRGSGSLRRGDRAMLSTPIAFSDVCQRNS